MKTTILLLGLLVSVSASAQSLVDAQRDSVKASHRIVVIDDEHGTRTHVYNDSIRQVINAFYYDQFRNFSDPEAPYFLFMSRDASLAMGIGGAVRMRGYYDWNGAMPGVGFSPMQVPMHPSPTAMRHLGATMGESCLFFRVIGRRKNIANYQLYIEADFSGYEYSGFKLKKAYAIINDFTLGLANSTASDPAALPPIIDSHGPTNKIAFENILLRYMPQVGQHWVFAVAAETSPVKIEATEGLNEKVESWIPDGAAFVQYQWGPTSHVRLSGSVRALSYRNLREEQNHYRAGWVVMLSSVAHPLPQLTYYLTANYGHGYGSFGGDLSLGNYDLISDISTPGRMYAPAVLGGCVGLQWNFRPNLFVSAQCSHTRIRPHGGTAAAEDYKQGTMAAVNCFWNPSPRIQFGAEYSWAQRRNIDGMHRHANRISALAMFSF